MLKPFIWGMLEPSAASWTKIYLKKVSDMDGLRKRIKKEFKPTLDNYSGGQLIVTAHWRDTSRPPLELGIGDTLNDVLDRLHSQSLESTGVSTMEIDSSDSFTLAMDMVGEHNIEPVEEKSKRNQKLFGDNFYLSIKVPVIGKYFMTSIKKKFCSFINVLRLSLVLIIYCLLPFHLFISF